MVYHWFPWTSAWIFIDQNIKNQVAMGSCSCYCHFIISVLSSTFINNQKFISLIPMLVAIISLSVITLLDKMMKKTRLGPSQHGILQN